MTDDDDLIELREALAAQAGEVAEALLGRPSGRSGHELRWGRRGSLSVAIRGPKRGLWRDHEADEGGDLISLIRRERGGDFAAAVAWARAWLGLGDAADRPTHTPRLRPSREAQDAELAEDEARRIAFARRLWTERQPIGGTLAEHYLIEVRRIPEPSHGWPDSVAFHPGRRALIMAAEDDTGAVVAVQLVHLAADGRKAETTDNRPTKQSFGRVAGAAVRLAGYAAGPVLICEGPETAFSVWRATGRETWAALGSLAKVTPPIGRPVVAAADDDPQHSPAAKALRRGVEAWRAAGRHVSVIYPWPSRRQDKTDFNDLMKAGGVDAVAARIAEAIDAKPDARPVLLPLNQARAELRQAEERFFAAARAHWQAEGTPPAPPVMAIKAGVGLGKSTVARELIARELIALRDGGNAATAVLAVPTHALGQQQADAFNQLPEAIEAGLKAAVWRGREALDPEAEAGTTMCLDLPLIQEAQRLLLEIEPHCCSRTEGKGDDAITYRCPLFDKCGYQRQRQRQADLWIVPHQMLFGRKPRTLGNPAFLVIDESPWQAGLEGVDGRPMAISLDALATPPRVRRPRKGASLADDTRAAAELYNVTRAALAAHPIGPVQRNMILAAGMTGDMVEDARALTWATRTDCDLRPGAGPEARKAAFAAAAANLTIARRARLFGTLRDLLAEDGPEAFGWLSIEEIETEAGPVRQAHMRGRKAVHVSWAVPTMLIDALLAPALLRPFWPTMDLIAEIEAEAPQQRITQIIGRDFAKSALVPDSWRDLPPEEIRRRERNNRQVRAVVLREARRHGGALVVAQKAVADAWREHPAHPARIELAHFNALAGRDDWGRVPWLALVGRPLPPAASVERMAEALTGHALAARTGGYELATVPLVMRDGSQQSVETWRHADPVAEAIRAAICEGELVQALGRARGVNRTEADPVHILILAAAPLPVPIDATATWAELAPSGADLMLAEGGAAFEDAADAAAAYPVLWRSPDAARKAFQRERCGTFPYRESFTGKCPAPRHLIGYQRAGAGRRPAVVEIDPAVIPEADARAWIAARLGPLVTQDMPRNPRRRPVQAAAPPPVPEASPPPVAAPWPPSGPIAVVINDGLPDDLPPPASRPPPTAPPEPPAVVPLPAVIRGDVLPVPGLVHHAEAAARLAGLGKRLRAVRPPRPAGDGLDALRLERWRRRCAAAAAGAVQAAPPIAATG